MCFGIIRFKNYCPSKRIDRFFALTQMAKSHAQSVMAFRQMRIEPYSLLARLNCLLKTMLIRVRDAEIHIRLCPLRCESGRL